LSKGSRFSPIPLCDLRDYEYAHLSHSAFRLELNVAILIIDSAFPMMQQTSFGIIIVRNRL